jgi:hypothetical protein
MDAVSKTSHGVCGTVKWLLRNPTVPQPRKHLLQHIQTLTRNFHSLCLLGKSRDIGMVSDIILSAYNK